MIQDYTEFQPLRLFWSLNTKVPDTLRVITMYGNMNKIIFNQFHHFTLKTMYKNQKQVRTAFWQFLKLSSPELFKYAKVSKGQDQQITDIRVTFSGWMDDLYKSGQITEKQVNNYTL